ncbi:WD40/YVTN/BNR-like repeat-containing protein [Telluribacter sp.]|uniref:WD40/YVTN/BNR-like repeat-containing protein n=1 Tax=Telluribacter sp. TaxID=1978767 RepID=UPI002E0E0D09|nr:glycosyl hydrolase [Telluribacter sp.]
MRKILLCTLALVVGVSLGVSAQKKKKTTANNPSVTVTEPTAATDRSAGYEQRKKLDAASLVSNVKFRSIGPTTMSGRVVDLDVNNANPTQFFVAYASGGLWKTENNGMSFTPLFDHQSTMTIGDIAVDWKTNGQTIWVGTGENNSSRSSYAGDGVYKSTDGGKTWQQQGLEDTHHIGKVILHPTDPNTVWVAAVGHLYSPNAERGIYKTTDGGKTWSKTLYVDEKTGAIDLDVHPTNPNVLYAAMWHKERSAWNFVEGGRTSGIYGSTDGGSTWQLLSTPASGFPQGEGVGRIGLDIYQRDPNIIYAFVDNQDRRTAEEKKEEEGLTLKQLREMTVENFMKLPDLIINEFLDKSGFPEKNSAKQLKTDISGGKLKVKDLYDFVAGANDEMTLNPVKGAEVYRSEDGGKSWKKTHDAPLDLVYTFGYYFGQIFVASNDPNRVVTFGVPILLSEDGGKSWKSLDRDNVHADHHALWINPNNPNHMIDGNDGGLNLTYDSGRHWSHLNPIPLGQFYAIGVDMEKPYNVYGGLQDNGVWYGTSRPREEGPLPTWKSIMGGDGMQVQVDWRDNSTVYTGFQFGNYFRQDKNRSGFSNMKRLVMPREIGDPKLRFNWQAPIHLSRHNQDIVYFGSNKFHRSMDKGETFATLSDDLTKGGKEGDVPYGTLTIIDESPKRFGLLYTGSDDGLVHVSKDDGYTWTKISDALPQNLWVSRVAASAHEEGTVYVSLNGYRNDNFKPYLYASQDYGQTWKAIGTDLPAEPINVVKEDPANANILYVGTDHGVYISLDKGTSFMRMSGGLPAVAVHDLLVHPRDKELVVGTHGRSIYIADVSLVQQLADTLRRRDLYAFALEPVTHSERWGQVSKYEETKPQQYQIPYYAKSAGRSTISIQTDQGLTLRSFTDDSEAGLNYATWNLTVDESAKAAYEQYLNETRKNPSTSSGQDKEVKLEVAEDKNLYVRAGTYKVVVTTTGGAKTEQKLTIKAPEKRPSRRAVIPGSAIPSTPGEWEEYMEEELGLEEVK